MMSSKLDYLSKYLEDPSNQTKKDKKKKKKKKSSKREEARLVVKDEDEPDDLLLGQHAGAAAADDDSEGEDEEGPVIVNEEALDANASFTRGQWENVSESNVNESKRRKRYDSDDDEDAKAHSERRHDSSDDDHGQKNKVKARHDSDSSSDEVKDEKSRMSSGHRAGLQTGRGFAEAEADIRLKRNTQAQDMVDRYGMGETVHREKEATTGKPILTAAQQAEINQGKYQKEKAAREHQQFEQMQLSEFARRVDDDEIETLRKQSLREGDPMAKYAKQPSKKTKGASKQQAPSRPVYKGPPPKQNRFGIRPGFRWDGNDRGNGFEDRILAQRSSRNHRQEEAYRWSSAGL